MSQAPVNSRAYWNDRFGGGSWESCSGPEQTAFFGKLLVDGLPQHILTEIRKDRLSMCDIGCAQGELTARLKAMFPECRVVGSDFSEKAIARARESHPGVEFCVEDSQNPAAEPFDVIICSNMLEHFADPQKPLADMAQRAKRFFILMVPVDDSFGIDEHLFSFTYHNLDVLAVDSFKVLHGRDIDAGLIPDGYWPGRQLLLVYERAQTPAAGAALSVPVATTLLQDVAAATEAWRKKCFALQEELFGASQHTAFQHATIEDLNEKLALAAAEEKRLCSELKESRETAADWSLRAERAEESLKAVYDTWVWRIIRNIWSMQARIKRWMGS